MSRPASESSCTRWSREEFPLEHVGECAGDCFPGGDAEDVVDVLFLDVAAAEGDELVEHGLGVAHAAVSDAGNAECSRFCESYALLGSDVHQVLGDDGGGNRPQVEALAAGEDGGKDFVRLRGGKDEFDVWRGFFKRFEQGVEGFLGQHVYFVDIHDAELAPGGGELDVVAQVADVVDAAVGGTVDFQYVETPAFGDFFADIAMRVEVGFGAVRAVQRFGEDAGSGCFARSSGADEKGRREPGGSVRSHCATCAQRVLVRGRRRMSGDGTFLQRPDSSSGADSPIFYLPEQGKSASGHAFERVVCLAFRRCGIVLGFCLRNGC